MDAKEIEDRDSLEAWLKTRPQSESVIFACRNALTWAPSLYSSKNLRQLSNFAEFVVATLRCLLTAYVASNRSSLAINLAASDASFLSRNLATSSLERVADNPAAGFALSFATLAVDAAFAENAAAAAYLASLTVIPLPETFSAQKVDALTFQSGNNPFTFPLWHNSLPPDWFTEPSAAMRTYWQTNNPTHWAFWHRWYDAAIAGRPLDWQLQHDIALIPDEIWQSGPGPVAKAIAKIEAEHLAARTDNGERLEINPETGLVRLVAETDLPDDISLYARRKMAKALSVLGDTTENQYRPLEPAKQVVRTALDDAANLPVELFDACASAMRLVATMLRNDVIPSPDQDARINEFLTQLREAGADILANDPKTQDVLTRRNSILGNDALREKAEALDFVVQHLVTISEGRLARALPYDAAIVVNPASDLTEAKDSRYRLVGRLIRFASFGAKGITKVTLLAGEAVGAVITLHAALTWLMTTPQFQQVWLAILKVLGFA